MRTKFENHGRSFLKHAMPRLRARKPVCWVLAVLITETYFRDSLRRAAEYVAWILLYYICRDRAIHLSVGVAQVQVRHWVDLGFLATAAPRLQNIRITLSIVSNHDVIQAYLRRSLPRVDAWSARAIAACYVGEARSHYVRVLEAAHGVATTADTVEVGVACACLAADGRRPTPAAPDGR